MIHNRIRDYLLFGLLLAVLATVMSKIHCVSSASLHTLMEVLATTLALVVGVMALIRYYSHAENKYLLVGIGFIGAGLLDAFHSTVTSFWFHQAFPSNMENLVPWSWIASRMFLSIMLMFSVIPWLRRHPPRIEVAFKPAQVYLLALLAIAICFVYIAFVRLPQAHYAAHTISRPEEWLPAIFFSLALLGYLRQGSWKNVDVDHWMVLTLIASIAAQILFMEFSSQLFDTRFDLAHLLKQCSYLLALSGLLISTYKAFKQLEQEILEHRQADIKNRMLVTAIEKSPVAVMITNADARIEYCNSKALDMLGYNNEEVIGQNPKIFASKKMPVIVYNTMWETLLNGGDWQGIFYNQKKNGEELIEESHISPIIDENHDITHFVAIKLDATERMSKEQDIWHKANYDLLTGLPNRGLFLNRVENALKNSKRTDANVAILFIDLDGFKAVNDTYGHGMGDRLLQWVAFELSRAIRDNDTVARFGGDEFGVLLSDFEEKQEVQIVADKVLAAINQPFIAEDIEISISASIGVALYPDHGDEVDILLSRADSAMYLTKKNNGRGIAFYLH